MKKIKGKADSKDTKDKIIELFYEENLKTTDVAEQLGIAKSYVTKVIQKDERYVSEKEIRKNQSKERQKIAKRNYINKRRQAERQEYEQMIRQINKDNEYLSKKKKLSDEQFARWNRSIYEYDKNSSDLVLNKGIKTGYNAPKRVSNRISV